MQAFTNSAFLQALGYALANSLWQMAILWLVYMVVSSVIRLSAANKYKVAAGLQLTGFAWFIVTLQFYYAQCHKMASAYTATAGENITLIIPEGGDSFRSQLLSTMIRAERILPYLSVAYLVLFVIMCIRWLNCYRFTQKLKTTGLQKADIDLKLFVKKVAAHLGIRQEVKVYLSGLVKSPLTIGFLKPVILIPLANINQLTTEQMEAVLLHELAHIKRFDYLLNLLLSCTETVLFFNPFTQLLSKAIKKERENSCDDWVLQFQYNPATYAEALLRIAYLQQTAPAMAMAALGNKNDLLSRIKRMIGQQEKKFNYRQQLAALLLMTCILSSLAWFNPKQQQQTQHLIIAGNNQAVVLEPMAAKVKNPLFNPIFFMQKPLHEEVEENIAAVNIELKQANEALAHAHKEIAKALPTAIKGIQSVDWKNVHQEINCSMDELAKEMPMVTNEMRNGLNEAKIAIANEDALKDLINLNEWKKTGNELKKAGIDLEQFLKDKKFISTKEGAFIKAEVDKAMMELKKLSIPFVTQSALQTLQQSINIYTLQAQNEMNENSRRIAIARQKADSLKVAGLTMRKAYKAMRTKTPENLAFMDVPAPAPPPPAYAYQPAVFTYDSDTDAIVQYTTTNTPATPKKPTAVTASQQRTCTETRVRKSNTTKTTTVKTTTPKVQIVIESDDETSATSKQITIEIL
jgi:beta-lactamase regulating signal transducer with metallopeptidase domain